MSPHSAIILAAVSIAAAASTATAAPTPCADVLESLPCAGWGNYQECYSCVTAHKKMFVGSDCTIEVVADACRSSGTPGAPANRTLLSDVMPDFEQVDGGRCLDGTSAGFYYRPANAQATSSRPDAATTWVIFLEGGGACTNKEDCEERATWELGSSKDWDPDMRLNKALLVQDCNRNPGFCDAHAVFVRYCTGDLHLGTHTEATEDTFNLHFDGHLNLKHILDVLERDSGLGDASHILFTGNSAGGIGSLFQLDFLKGRFPSAAVKGAPGAGWYYPADTSGSVTPPVMALDYENWVADTDVDISEGLDAVHGLWARYIPPACEAAMLEAGDDVRKCTSAHWAYPHIDADIFIIMTQYESNQMGNMGLPPMLVDMAAQMGYIAYQGELMRDSLSQIAARNELEGRRDGLFSISCFAHGVNGNWALDGVLWPAAVADWFFETDDLPTHVLVDSCVSENGMPCNAQCPLSARGSRTATTGKRGSRTTMTGNRRNRRNRRRRNRRS